MKFLSGVKKELDKVTWLKKKEVWSQFIVIHVICILIIAYFGLLDGAVALIKNLF